MFREILETIVTDCNGGLGALLMGYDGIAVDQFTCAENDLDLNLIGVEYSNILKEIRRAAELLKLGELTEVALNTEQVYLVIQHLNEDYFVALLIERTGNYGQGRYLLRREAPQLREAL